MYLLQCVNCYSPYSRHLGQNDLQGVLLVPKKVARQASWPKRVARHASNFAEVVRGGVGVSINIPIISGKFKKV